jgi:predicted lipoprotein with Yx(FWY)xxD motif
MKNKKRLLILSIALMIPASTITYASSSHFVKGEKTYSVTEKASFKAKDKADFEVELAKKGMTMEEYKAIVAEKFAKLAEAKGMTVIEYKQALADSKENAKTKMSKEDFKAQLAAKGMTMEEYKALVVEKFAELAKAKGMTVEELKAKMGEDKKTDYEAFKAKAESMGITVEKLKTKMIEAKKSKVILSNLVHLN